MPTLAHQTYRLTKRLIEERSICAKSHALVSLIDRDLVGSSVTYNAQTKSQWHCLRGLRYILLIGGLIRLNISPD